MVKGPFGYGRYNDDLAYVGCPRAKSDMTPCIARDGGLALADNNKCVGCNASPGELLKEINVTPTSNQPKAAADTLCVEVLRITDPTTEYKKETYLITCWSCMAPMETIDGKSKYPLTFWKKDGKTITTPHKPECEYRGKADTGEELASKVRARQLSE